MNKKLPVWFCAAALLLSVSCASTHNARSPRALCGDHFAEALSKYNAGKISTAKALLEDMKQSCAGSDLMDSVEYYFAMSLMRMKFYPEAKLEFSHLSEDFPHSPFHEEARFRIGYCILKSTRSVDRDQSETLQAQKLFTDFLETYPSSIFVDSARKYMELSNDRLAEKEFTTAHFYQKLGERDAAVIYYKSFIQEYPASHFVPQARLNLGQLLIDLNRCAEAKEVLNELSSSQGADTALVRTGHELLQHCKE